ncbi:hypothetical protein F4861DRAFT_545915 [Xylaria intraflava]|nr:hypothetical protein F4861DRAFT_545915 [Xylaria intraflava]
MDRKSVGSHGGSIISFKSAQEMPGTQDSFIMQKSNLPKERPTSGIFIPKKASAMTGGIDKDVAPEASAEFFQGPPAPKVTRKITTQVSEEAESSEAPRHNPQYNFTRSVPMAIPNAVERIRLPVKMADGLLVMSGARAPVTMEEARELDKIERKEHAQNQELMRRKQGVRKWMSESREASYQYKGAKGENAPGGNWARRSISKVKDILNSGRSRECAIESSSSDQRTPVGYSFEPIPVGSPPGRRFVRPRIPIDRTRGDVYVGNAIMLGEEPSFHEFHKHVMKPFSHQYGHTTASIAYEEGLATGAYKQGYKDGIEKAHLDKAYEKGVQDGMKAYQFAPKGSPSQSRASNVTNDLPLIFKKDGSGIFRFEIFEGITKMMDNLEVPRADGLDDSEDIKGKGKVSARSLWEVKEFVKNVSAELEKIEN